MSGEPKIRLEITPPDENAPGFLRRQHQTMQFMHKLEAAERTGKYDPNMISDLVDFLADLVVDPADPEKAKEILWDLSQVQYMQVMKDLQGGSDLVPPTKESL